MKNIERQKKTKQPLLKLIKTNKKITQMNQIESTHFLVLLSDRRVASLSSKSQHAKNKKKGI